jgi:hypothetical protein
MSDDQSNTRICQACGSPAALGTRSCDRCGEAAPSGNDLHSESLDYDDLPPSAAFIFTAWTLSLIGALAGGAICIALWTLSVVMTRSEYMVFVVAMGALPGVGAMLLSFGRKGVVTGVLAAVVTLGTVAGSLYTAGYFIIKTDIDAETKEFVQGLSNTWMTDLEAKEVMAYRSAFRAERDGDYLIWPEGMDLSNAIGILDYPASIAAPIREEWSSLDGAARKDRIDMIMAETQISIIANDMAFDRIERGEYAQWPVGMTYEYANLIEDYPADIVRSAASTWNSMTRNQQVHYLVDYYDYTDELTSPTEVIKMLKSEYELADRIMYALLTLVAIVLAYVIGAGVGIEDNSSSDKNLLGAL